MRGVTIAYSASSNQRAFQLTRLMRGVTGNIVVCPTPTGISTHTPHARRDQFDLWLAQWDTAISTHTPHARRDDGISCNRSRTCEFQLTRLMRGVTGLTFNAQIINNISTHTPHARRDVIVPSSFTVNIPYFNSHASCEA